MRELIDPESSVGVVDLTDPYQRLATVLEEAKEIKQSHHMLIEPSIHGFKYCALGYARKAGGQNLLDIVFPDYQGTMKLYGFPKRDTMRFRRCPEAGCKFVGRLNALLAHLNDYHKLQLPIIGKLVIPIKNDARPEPTLKEFYISSIRFFVRCFLP